MRKDDLWAGFCGGVIVGSFLISAVVTIRDEYRVQGPINECERINNVYQCKLVPMPVDPFHPEEPTP